MTDETKNDGGPAFPLIWNSAHNSEWNTEAGMTLRDWFAGQALAGIAANPEEAKGSIGLSLSQATKVTAQAAYLLADAMIAERSK